NLFVAEKIKILFDSSENTLVTLGTTFPTLVFLTSLIFTPFGYLFAPILASIALSVTLYYTLLSDFRETSKLPPFIYIPLVSLLFVLHPGIIYAAISGRGVAAIMLFFYFTFRSLFRYYKTQTTFYLSMASIYLTCLVFCDFNFIWLLLAFFPFIVLVSLEGLKINKIQAPVTQYFESVNNVSQRRKLTNRAIAIYIVLFLLPLGALFLFGYLNDTHAGISTYFLHSQYANWHVMGDIPLGQVVGRKGTNAGFQSQILFQFYVLFLNPLLILAFLYFKGKLYELFTLIAPFILMGILIINMQFYFMVEYYLLFLILALVGLSFYAGKQFTKKATWFIVFTVGLLNVFTGIFYFKRTDDLEEKKFFSVLRHYKSWLKEKNNSEDFQVAEFIASIANVNNKVLIDDAAAFQIVAHLKSLEGVELPLNKSFGTIIENPIIGVRYMCVAKNTNPLRNFTVLNAYNLDQMQIRGQFASQVMFETPNWAVYRLYAIEN
ncbi:hypothetical protein, partial [Parasediminibacterium sp. JCM 36343]|uniref:hypothetical protein n=1 Tax=Parasediminibacterium sp. JCM 36343 TaxID=3374279 RepID=UPI00397A0C8B